MKQNQKNYVLLLRAVSNFKLIKPNKNSSTRLIANPPIPIAKRLFSGWQRSLLFRVTFVSDDHVASTDRNGQWKSPENIALTQSRP